MTKMGVFFDEDAKGGVDKPLKKWREVRCENPECDRPLLCREYMRDGRLELICRKCGKMTVVQVRYRNKAGGSTDSTLKEDRKEQ